MILPVWISVSVAVAVVINRPGTNFYMSSALVGAGPCARPS
jgi:hypothetical protein